MSGKTNVALKVTTFFPALEKMDWKAHLMWIMMVNWKFSWIGSKNVYALVGHAIVNPDSTHITPFTPFKVDIIMPNPKLRLISSPLDASRFPQGKYQRHKCARYDLYLVALETPLAEYEKMFSESEDTDAVLVVEDKRLHVNKEFLSLHSTYFAELFKKSEITIEDLSYEDFGLLMSNIYPKVIFPNDFTAEKILELAVRFKVPAAVALVENQLLHHSTLSHGKLLLLADKYEMHRLSGQQVRKIYTKEVAEKLRRSTEYSELSNRARARIGECLLQLF